MYRDLYDLRESMLDVLIHPVGQSVAVPDRHLRGDLQVHVRHII